MKKTIRFMIPVVSLLVLIAALFVLFKTDFFKRAVKKSMFQKQEQERVRTAGELEDLKTRLQEADKNQNQAVYMNLVREIIAKEQHLDALWSAGNPAAVAVDQAPEFFTRDQKIRILAESHGIDPAVISDIKDELEIMFEYEYVEKFSRT